MAEVPQDEDTTDEQTVTTVTDGYFEEEYYVSAAQAGTFLATLGDQLGDSDELTISGEDWELPFAFDDTVKLDIEFEGDHDPELEIEVELTGRRDEDTPDLA
ncbi:MAG: amphi-Trp domain-containing protein [Halobacteriaceae archaeon]